jgi:hypothetical protein
MTSVSPLLLQLTAWLDERPRTYAETMEAWRTSCPRLSTWEDAVDQGLVRRRGGGPQAEVALSVEGKVYLAGAGTAS